MSLSSGTRFGPYEIVDLLGAGGMGEVYRAKDTKLGRDVALKFLSDAVAGDPDRLARFQREAHVLASLNHTHIAAIYGLEHDSDTTPPFLVMELVEGEDLSRRIARGAVPLEEALPIAKQIAEALEAAHDAGVVHRDLKPANIKLRPDGTVKVLDFGLAKIALAEASDSSRAHLSHSPTITNAAQMTSAGVVLGTAAYMSPEQAKGRPVDKRADVWAFGAVLYEMLTGRRTFEGEDVSDTLAAILRAQPDWTALPAETPQAIRRLLRRCLERDTRARLSDMAMVRVELRDAATESGEPTTASAIRAPRPSKLSRAAPYAAAVALAAITGVAVWVLTRPVEQPRPITRFSIALPNGTQFAAWASPLAISPTGTHMAYAANQRLYLHALDQFNGTPVDGTEGKSLADSPRAPFFSADGQWVAFWQFGQLKKVSVSGGAPITIATMPPQVGASWGADNRILIGAPGTGAGILQIDANGGKPETVIAPKEGERTSNPYALDEEWVLFVVHSAGTSVEQGQVVVQSRKTGAREVIVESARDVRFLPTGHLLFARGNVLFAQPFDPVTRTVHGSPVSVVEGVASAGVLPPLHMAISSAGALVYHPGTTSATVRTTLVQMTREGTRSVLLELTGVTWFPRYSPDGSRVAYGLSNTPDLGETSDLWVVDLDRGARTRVTFEANNRFYPIWTRDGARLTFADGTGATNRLRSARADGSGGLETIGDIETRRFPTSWSPDGRALAYYVGGGNPNSRDLWMLHVDGDKRTAKPFVQTPFEERGAIFSPTGRWVAYVSNKSGQNDIYARPYPGPGGEVTISVGGGQEPVWGPAGRELFYRRAGKLLVVTVEERGASLSVGAPKIVFDDPYRLDTGGANGGVANYDISPDGKRFVMVEDPQASVNTEPARMYVVLNWFDELKRRVPTK